MGTATVRRQGLLDLIAAPCVAAGSIVGHAVGSRLASSPLREVAEGPASRVEAHAPMAPVLLGFFGALLVVAALVAAVWRRQRRRGVPPLLFLVLPIAAWPMQEAFERLAHVQGFALHAASDPSLLLGAALQIPFGIAAFFLAHLLFHLVKVAVQSLRRSHRSVRTRTISTAAPLPHARVPRTRVTALRRAQRGPPGWAVS